MKNITGFRILNHDGSKPSHTRGRSAGLTAGFVCGALFMAGIVLAWTGLSHAEVVTVIGGVFGMTMAVAGVWSAANEKP